MSYVRSENCTEDSEERALISLGSWVLRLAGEGSKQRGLSRYSNLVRGLQSIISHPFLPEIDDNRMIQAALWSLKRMVLQIVERDGLLVRRK